jgi:pyridoxal phosphate enzyme (YggS family)
MPVNREAYQQIIAELKAKKVLLVAVSKTRSIEEIKELYDLGQRDFGENYVQEMTEKTKQLPSDIRWHFIGHLQTNKVKLIVPFVQLMHGIDSLKLLKEINKEAIKLEKKVDCLLQVHIAQEETKFGFDEKELIELSWDEIKAMNGIHVTGLMGMASFSDNMDKVRLEFRTLKSIFDQLKKKDQSLNAISMGMSADFRIAIEEGSTMVRIGTLLFGQRN